MEFPGHIDLTKSPINIQKMVISSITNEGPFICDEYYYSNGRLIKHIDYINWKVSYHEYDIHGNRTQLRTFGFDDVPGNAILEGYKRFEYESNKLKKEIHYLVFDDEEELEYEGSKIYDGDDLIQEDFCYSDETYTIKHYFDKNTTVRTSVYPGNDGNAEYYFDQDGFLIRYINFKYEGCCQINDYQYQDGKLHKLIEYPHQRFRRDNLSKKIVVVGEPEFIHETEYSYDSLGKLIKEVKTDTLNNHPMDELIYTYESNII